MPSRLNPALTPKVAYASVMNEEENPLQRLPKVVRFQLMVVLSVMWTTIFSLALGSWLWWGELVIGHVAIAVGILITGMTFREAERRQNTAGAEDSI